MRNISPRVPYGKLANSQPINVKLKQIDLAQKIGKEEDDYLNDMNQFYLDYHNYEQKRLYVMKLKQLQLMSKQENIIKSTFSKIILDQLNQRKKNAIQILSEPIINNSKLENEVKDLEAELIKYQKLLNQKSSIQYLYGDLSQTSNDFANNFKNKNMISENENQSIDNKKDCYISIESIVLNNQLLNEEKQMELKRREIFLNQQLKEINDDIFRTKNSLQLYKMNRYTSNPNHCFLKDVNKDYNNDATNEFMNEIINQRKISLQEKDKEICQFKEKLDKSRIQNQAEYEECENKFLKLTEEMNYIESLKKELFQINEEISIGNCELLKYKNDCYDLNRKLLKQNEEIQSKNDEISKLKDNINEKESVINKKKEEIDKKKKTLEKMRNQSNVLENELSTMKLLLLLKQKNVQFIQNKLDKRIKGDKTSRNPVKRLLQLDNLGLKKSIISNKPFSIKRNENIMLNQF